MSAWRPPPRFLVWLSVAIIALGVVVMVVGAVRIGVTVDETFHVVRLQNYLDRGWYLLDDDFAGAGGPGDWVADAFVYAPVTSLLLHAANVMLGNEDWSTVSSSADAYAVRHLGIVVVALLGTAATAVLARVVAGSWRWGVVTAGLLMSLPMWAGHGMFNVKDIPVATGYTWVTLGCVLVLSRTPSGRRLRLATWAVVASGVLLLIGTRPAMWLPMAATLGWTVLVLLRRDPDTGRRWRQVAGLASGCLVPLVALAVIYPNVFARPDLWILGSVGDSSSNQMVRSRGHLPFALTTTVPVVLLVLGMLGTYGRFAGWRRGPTLFAGRAPLLVLLWIQVLLLPTLMVVASAPVSGGLRHVLFAVPAAAVLLAAAVAQLSLDAGRGLVAGLTGIGMVLPVTAQVQLFPYSYAYANEITDLADLPEHSDFWRASFREYADDIAPGTFVACGADLDDQGRPLPRMPGGGQSLLDVSRDCSHGPLGVMTPYVSPREPLRHVPDEFVALRNVDEEIVGCRQLASVTRPRLWNTVVLSTAAVCPLVLPPYDGPITPDGAGTDAHFLLDGWTGDGGADVVEVEDVASLGFFAPALTASSSDGVTLEVHGESGGPVTFRINNDEAETVEMATGWRVRVPRLSELGAEGNVVLTIEASQDAITLQRVELVGDGA